MSKDDWKTLRVPPERYEEAKAQKEEHNRTWGEQLVCSNPTTIEVVEAAEVVESLSQQLDQIQSAQASTVEDSLGIAEGDLADIKKRLDDIESQLPRKVANELR